MFGFDFVDADLADKPEKCFMVDDIGDMVHMYCDSAKEARMVQNRLQSIDGSTVERDGAFVYCMVNNMDEAIKELEEAGFSWEEAV